MLCLRRFFLISDFFFSFFKSYYSSSDYTSIDLLIFMEWFSTVSTVKANTHNNIYSATPF